MWPMEDSGSMEQVKSSKGRPIAVEYFTAQPFGDGFHVRDEVLGRTYTVPRVGQPALEGRPVSNRWPPALGGLTAETPLSRKVAGAERGASHRHRLMLSLPQNQGRTKRCLRRRTPSMTSAAPDVTYASDRAAACSIPNAWSSSALLQFTRSP
jgi:hypothetical protein